MKPVRWISRIVACVFLINTLSLPVAQAQELSLPRPGVMVALSPKAEPAVLTGIKIHPDQPFRFDFIIDEGGAPLTENQLKNEASDLAKYFLAALTIPEKDLWVNLSPYEKDRVIPESFGATAMGRDMLASDYLLKQIASTLFYPMSEKGGEFWRNVRAQAKERFGNADIPVNATNKVWIVPQKAVVYVNPDGTAAYVTSARLKVMLEADYLAANKQGIKKASPATQLSEQVVRQVILPALDREVNEGQHFARLRQAYHSLILAAWFKRDAKQHLLAKVFADKVKTAGVHVDDPREQEHIYQHYLESFKKGVFNLIRDEEGQRVPRKYFSGGANLNLEGVFERSPQLPDAGMTSGKKQVSIDLAMAAAPKQQPKIWWRESGTTHVVESMPVAALRRQTNDPGIGKFTDLGRYYRETASKKGITVLSLLPFYPVLEESPYAPLSMYALNEDYIDWRRFLEKELWVKDPVLLKKTTAPGKEQREIHYESVRQREKGVAAEAYALLLKNPSGRYKELIADLKNFAAKEDRLGRELRLYAQLRAREDGSSGSVDLYVFKQWLAYRQFKDAVEQVHTAGGRIVFDIPFFRGKKSVDAAYHPEYFRDAKTRNPGLIKKGVHEDWTDLLLWDWDHVRTNDFEVLTDPARHWLTFGLDGARLDALHFAYDIGQKHAFHEPGDALAGAYGRLFAQYNALAYTEGFEGKKPDVERNGIMAIDGIFKRMSTHDDQGRFYYEASVEFLKRFLTMRREDQGNTESAGFIGITIGDLTGDPESIKVQADGASYWRYRIPMPKDPDYKERTRVDLGPFILFHTQKDPKFHVSPRDVLNASKDLLVLVKGIFESALDSYVKHRKRQGKDVVEVWAGSRGWFMEQWGRDTFISMTGVLLSTGRFEEAKNLMLSFSRLQKNGLIPNRIADSSQPQASEYNTVDAPLLFIQAVKKYGDYTKDRSFLEGMVPVIAKIISAYEQGTGYDKQKHINDDPYQNVHRIEMDARDGLIAGPAQATWMDADPHGTGPVTPRNGKAVEINALWYASLLFYVQLLKSVDPQSNGELISHYEQLAQKVKKSFNERFWNESESALLDVIDGDPHGGAIRPNMIMAVSLGEDLLSLERQKMVLDSVQKDLLTPQGLRTLSPRDSYYRPYYDTETQPYPADKNFGQHKDYAYHQGTVWPWLIGPYVDALVKVQQQEGRSRQEIQDSVKAVLSFLVQEFLSSGSLHEVYDADLRSDGTRHPGGNTSQAWSLAEVFRVLMEYGILPQSLKDYLPGAPDSAQIPKDAALPTGGIDLSAADLFLEIQKSGRGAQYSLDPGVLKRLKDVPGFVPVVISVQPVKDLTLFLAH